MFSGIVFSPSHDNQEGKNTPRGYLGFLLDQLETKSQRLPTIFGVQENSELAVGTALLSCLEGEI